MGPMGLQLRILPTRVLNSSYRILLHQLVDHRHVFRHLSQMKNLSLMRFEEDLAILGQITP